MIHTGSSRRWGGCPAARESQWRCRLIERDDLRRALRLYGGRRRPLRAPPVCFKHPRPRAPSGLRAEVTVTEGPAGWSVRGSLAWRNPDSRSFAGVQVAYRSGACPTSPSPPDATVLFAEADDSFVGDRTWRRRRGATSSVPVSLDALTAGEHCFAVWSTDEAALRRSRASATVRVTLGPPAQPRIP